MALSKTLKRKIYGKDILIEDCYMKITNINGSKDKITLEVTIYSNDKIYQIDTQSYTFVPDVSDSSTNFIKQGYDYLKTLDEYSGCIDLLDEGQVA